MTLAKETSLYEKHVAAGAKMIEFAGYWMPIHYGSITEEHLAVRTDAGLFDVSHMGEFVFRGEKAMDFLNYITTNNVSRLQIGQAQYSAMCYPDGGIVDDLLVYRFPDHYMTVVNAANIQKDFDHINSLLPSGVEALDRSNEIALLALQGPKAQKILQPLSSADLSSIKFYWFEEGTIAGVEGIISCTGYTGEPGFELYVDQADAGKLWDGLMDEGRKYGLKPAGLGARDSLRLEMKFALYGNDITKDTNPLEAGLGWITKLKKGDFLGREALVEIKRKGVSRKLVGFEVAGKAFPRPHYPVIIDGIKVTEVTSGTFSPSLKKGIGLAFLPIDKSEIGQLLEIDMRGRRIPGIVVETPFYRKD